MFVAGRASGQWGVGLAAKSDLSRESMRYRIVMPRERIP